MGMEGVSLTSPPASPIIISPPLTIDSPGTNKVSLDNKQKSVIFQVLDLLKGMRPGTDLTTFQLPAQLNMPKSQLQCYGEQVYCSGDNLLELCTDGATPLDRFLAVVRWQLSTTRPVPFGKAPYNPILGETHHVTAGDLNLLVEQVSHHPPVSALYGTNSKRKIEILQWNFSRPKFFGNAVTVAIDGRKKISLLEHGETYEFTLPKLNFRFWPGTCSEWVGDTTLRCAQTGLEASISYKSRSYFSRSNLNQVHGKIFRTSSSQVLYTLSGSWDKTVMIEDKEKGNKTLLYDGNTALTNLKTSVLSNQQGVSPTESVVVWRKLTEGICKQDWELARTAKATVEEGQRDLRKERSDANETWEPKYFIKSSHGDWEWAHKGQPVSLGPITW